MAYVPNNVELTDKKRFGRGYKVDYYTDSTFKRKRVYKNASSCSKIRRFCTLNKVRRFFYLAIFLLCLGAFISQISEFYSYYIKYPMTINVEIVFATSDSVFLPAVSVCYSQPVMKSKLCQLEKYAELCDKNDIPDLYHVIQDLTMKEFAQVRYTPETLFEFFNVSGFPGKYKENLLHRNVSWSHKGRFSCFTVNEQWHYSPLRTVDGVKNQLDFYFMANFNDTEILEDNDIRQGFVYIHSPFAIPLETEVRVPVNPGNMYELSTTRSQILLLEKPYETKCKNYSSAWMESNFTEPLGRYNCMVRCRNNILKKICKCVPALSQIITEDYSKCVGKNELCPSGTNQTLFENCSRQCPNRCDLEMYTVQTNRYTMDENLQCFGDSCFNLTNTKNLVMVHVYSVTYRTLIYRHMPKYQKTEIFGYVGGFLGIWLGMSIPAIYKFADHVTFLAYYKAKRQHNDFEL